MSESSIGGYFGLETRNTGHYHKDAIRLNTARNCFEYILAARGYEKIYIPHYACNAILEPLQRQHVAYAYYDVDEDLEPIGLPELTEGEAFLYTNYFGLKQACAEKLHEKYGDRLIVDNAQAFFSMPVADDADTFYSARKFFGVPDGAYLYTGRPLDVQFPQDHSAARMEHLLVRVDSSAEQGYAAYRQSEESLCGQTVKRMSALTDRLLASIDYEDAMAARLRNFRHLDERLGSRRFLKTWSGIPMVYPYLADDEGLKRHLIENRIYVATYWPEVAAASLSPQARKTAAALVPLPVDQRYGIPEMDRIIKAIKTYEKHK